MYPLPEQATRPALADTLVSIVLPVYNEEAVLNQLVDAVSDPLMGRISDHTTWKMGRRRPWFLIGMLPFSISFAALWATPFDGQAAMFAKQQSILTASCQILNPCDQCCMS